MHTAPRPTRSPRAAAAALAVVALVIVLTGCGVVHTSSTLGPARPLTIALDGPPSALYAPIYEAIADGDFTQGALSVTVTPGSSDVAALGALMAGQAQVAIVSEPAVLTARAAGTPVVAIGALERSPLEAIISLHPLSSAAQLAGKTVASDGTPLAAAELATCLAKAGVSPARVRTIAGGEQALTQRKAFAAIGGRWDYDAVALALAHHHPNVIRLDQAGVPSFTDLAIVVRVSEARYQGAVLRAFLQSLTRGETATLASPQAVVQLLVQTNPQLGAQFEIAALAATQTVSAPSQGGEPWGFQNPVTWQTFGNWMHAHGLLANASLAGDTITDEFLPGQGE
jgi:putative hydroxymethylpyrimidine transport system substrate-binding protein